MHQSILTGETIKRIWNDIRLALLMLLMVFTALEGEWRVQNLLRKFRERLDRELASDDKQSLHEQSS